MQYSYAALLRQTILSLTAIILSVSTVAAQDLNTVVRLSGSHITLGKALSDIEQQTRFTVAFNIAQVDTGKPVRFERNSMTVREALDVMTASTPYKYVVRNHFILISPDSDNPERANVVARARDNEPVSDTLVARPVSQPHASLEDRLYEIERTETIIPGEAVERNFPQSYSAYLPVDRYPEAQAALPTWVITTNVLYGSVFLAPNLGVEMGIKPRRSIEITGSYNNWKKDKKTLNDKKQLRHAFVRPEYRWWLCERFNGHFFGAHAFWASYNVSGHKIPLIFKKKYRYDGQAYGVGATYGYVLPLAKQWNMAFHFGAGVAYMDYDKFTCEVCDRDPKKTEKFYLGPTRIGITFSFIIK